MYGTSNMETYVTMCKIDSQREFAVWLRKRKQGLRINLKGWDEEADGREIQKGGDICMPIYIYMTMSLQMVIVAMKLKDAYSLEEKL